MNRRTVLSLAATSCVALFSFNGQTALAQFPGGGAPGGPGGFANIRRPNIVDPSRSAISILIRRDDVRAQILLSAKQREAIDGVDKQQQQAQQEVGQKMRDLFSGVQNMTPAERQAKIQEMRDQAQQIVQEYQNKEDKKLDAILKPDQMARLHELDLRWRGPLALSEKKVAEPFHLTPEQTTRLEAALKEYQDAQRSAMTAGFGGFQRGNPGAGANGGNRGNGGNGGAPPAPGANGNQPPAGFTLPTPEEIQKRMAEMEKVSEKALKAGSARALALLTPGQKQQWDTALGKPFTFRKSL